jgi:hypothetical protein
LYHFNNIAKLANRWSKLRTFLKIERRKMLRCSCSAKLIVAIPCRKDIITEYDYNNTITADAIK